MASTDSACDTLTVIGQKFITNSKYTNRNVDLKAGTVNAPIFGYRPDNNSPNQKFTFEPQATEGHVKISVVPNNTGGAKLYLASVDPTLGDKIRGVEGGVASIYTLHANDDGQVKFSIKCGEHDLFWTLNSADDDITLQRDNHSPNQLWGLADETSPAK